MDIDAVITWVDGNDPEFVKKKAAFGASVSFQEDDVAGATRYDSRGEIYWCVASLRKFAPFIRKIYLVTDGQDPHIPEGSIPVEVIDHQVIFRGYEKYLPVFNSIAIETMTWRIPGLSEHYLELNDDFLLCAPVSEEDFFTPDGRPVCYSTPVSIPFTRFTRAIKRKENGHRKVTFKGIQLNGARLAGARWRFFKLNHTPRALLRSFFEEWFSKHPDQLEHNLSFRFRDASQFSPEQLQYIRIHQTGGLVRRPVQGNLFYMEPKQKADYVAKKMEKLRSGAYKFCCFNSLDKASPEDFKQVLSWINATLSL